MGFLRCDSRGIYVIGTYPQSGNLWKKNPSQWNNQFSTGICGHAGLIFYHLSHPKLVQPRRVRILLQLNEQQIYKQHMKKWKHWWLQMCYVHTLIITCLFISSLMHLITNLVNSSCKMVKQWHIVLLEENLLKPRNPYLQPTDDQLTTEELNYSGNRLWRCWCPTETGSDNRAAEGHRQQSTKVVVGMPRRWWGGGGATPSWWHCWGTRGAAGMLWCWWGSSGTSVAVRDDGGSC